MNIPKLDSLVGMGVLESYELVDLSATNEKDVVSKFGNHQQLTLEFPNGETLSIDCMCSGASENLTLHCK